jgi:hypothetical protein
MGLLFNIAMLSKDDSPFWRGFEDVAECYAHALQELGHTVAITHNQFSPEAINIVFGLNQFFDRDAFQLPKRSVVVNLEQYFPGAPWCTASLLHILREHVVWDFAPENLDAFRALGVHKLFLVPIGSNPRQNRIPRRSSEFDVLHYGWLSKRREFALREMSLLGLRVKTLSGLYGAERDAYIARAKLVVQIRALPEYRHFEVVRASYLMTNGIPILSEWSPDTLIEDDILRGISTAPYSELPTRAKALCEDQTARDRQAEISRRIMADRPQARFLADAIAALPESVLKAG